MSDPLGPDGERAFVAVANAGIGRAIALGLAAAEACVIAARWFAVPPGGLACR